MRVSHESLVSQSLRRLERRLEAFEEIQVQMGTGKRFQRASEDVGGMNLSLGMRTQRRSLEQANRNASDGQSRVEIADSRLQQMNTSLRRARELVTRGANTLQQTERDAIAEELTAIRDELVGLANSRHMGQALFGGFTGGDAIQQVAGTWTYTGDTGAVQRRVGENQVVTVNVTGDETFGFNGAIDVFTLLDQVATDVRAGNVDAVSNAIADIEGAEDGLLNGLARLGSTGRTIETTMQRNLEQLETIRARQSDIEDVDLAEAVMELQTQEVALQATLGALARSLQPSLMDFLS